MPLPITPAQLGVILGVPREQVRLLCQALATLGAVDHPGQGYYRHKTPAPVLPVPQAVPCAAPAPAALLEASIASRAAPDGDVRGRAAPLGAREAQAQQVLALVRAVAPRPVSPKELEDAHGIVQARQVLQTLISRRQVERVRHGRYRYRGPT